MSDQAETGHSSVMWQQEIAEATPEMYKKLLATDRWPSVSISTEDHGSYIPYAGIAGAAELITGANERARLLLEAKDEWMRRALAERERCAKIAESIEEPIWAPNEWGEVGPAECRGGAPPAVNWEETRALIARKIREGA